MAIISKEAAEIASRDLLINNVLHILGLSDSKTSHCDRVDMLERMFRCTLENIFSGVTRKSYIHACVRLETYNESAVYCLKYTATKAENVALALLLLKPRLRTFMRDARLRNIIISITDYNRVLQSMRREAEQQINMMCDSASVTAERMEIVERYISGGLFMFYMYYIPAQCKNWGALTLLLLMTNPADYTYAKLTDLLRQILYMRYTPAVYPHDTTDTFHRLIDTIIRLLNRYTVEDTTRPLYMIPFAYGDNETADLVYSNLTIKRKYPIDRMYALCAEQMTNITPELRGLAIRINNN